MIVRYGKLYNLGNYENHRIEIEHEVPDGVSPQQAVEQLRTLVETEHTRILGEQRGYERAREAVYRAQTRLQEVKADIERMRRVWTDAKEMLEAMGLSDRVRLYAAFPEPEPEEEKQQQEDGEDNGAETEQPAPDDIPF